MRIRPNSTLAKLTPDQLDEVFDQIDSGVALREVQKRCELPPPDGFGVRVHLYTLSSYYNARRSERHAEELAESHFTEIAATTDREQLMQNVKIQMAHLCYDLAHRRAEPLTLNSLSRTSHRLDLLRLEQQRLDLERDLLAEKKRQFNFNAARVAAHHAAKIHKVVEMKGPDAEDRIWMVSDMVFGPRPQDPQTTNSNPTQ